MSKFVRVKGGWPDFCFNNEPLNSFAEEGDLIYTLTHRIEREPDKTETLPFEVGKEYKTRDGGTRKVIHLLDSGNFVVLYDEYPSIRYSDGSFLRTSASGSDLIPETRVVKGGLRMVPVE